MSRQVLVQRLLLPGNGNVNSTIPTNNNSINTSGGEIVTTLSPLSAASEPAAATTTTTNTTLTHSSNEVPWNYSDECKQRATTEIKPATTTTTVASNETTATATDECNATFLNALALTDFEELPQSSTSQYQQHYRDIQEQIRDRLDGAPSVDSAFDESSSKLNFFFILFLFYSYFDYLINNSIVDHSFLNGLTPMHLLRETSSNSKWLDDNINDFSLTSLLGHLDEINSSRDILVGCFKICNLT